jgi:predicted nucleotidyltransferase
MSVNPSQLAATLLTRHRVELARAALEQSETRHRVNAELASLELSERCWLIGSLVWGGFDESSDVDIVIDGLNIEDHARIWAHLTRRLSRRVDLLRLEDLPEDFRSRVMTEGLRPGVA